MPVDYADTLLEAGCPELTCLEFYREIFGYSSAYLKYGLNMQIPVTCSDWDGYGNGTWRSCALGDLPDYIAARNDAYVSACTYFPRRHGRKYESTNSQETANQLCAFVLDIDGGGGKNLYHALHSWWNDDDPESTFAHVLKPTFIVCSGGGLHLYFVLSEPVEMFERWRRELAAINSWLYSSYLEPYIEPGDKYGLPGEELTSDLGRPDRHGLTQPYRVVGSMIKSEYGEGFATAWRVGETYSITELAIQAGLDQTVFTVEDFDMGKSLRTAEFQANLEKSRNKKSDRKGHNPGVYKWLVKELLDRAKYWGTAGFRYNQIISLSICARKDKIPYPQLEADAKLIYEEWCAAVKRYNLEPILWSEVKKAMRMYNSRGDIHKYPNWWLSEKCGWKWESHQKRNGREQHVHLSRARAVQALDYPDGSWRYVPETKKDKILAYAAEHPDANHSEIARALGVSRPTVIKWLRSDSQ